MAFFGELCSPLPFRTSPVRLWNEPGSLLSMAWRWVWPPPRSSAMMRRKMRRWDFWGMWMTLSTEHIPCLDMYCVCHHLLIFFPGRIICFQSLWLNAMNRSFLSSESSLYSDEWPFGCCFYYTYYFRHPGLLGCSLLRFEFTNTQTVTWKKTPLDNGFFRPIYHLCLKKKCLWTYCSE